ncbi:hypothetical protein D3C87_866960 [compost metagenome]
MFFIFWFNEPPASLVKFSNTFSFIAKYAYTFPILETVVKGSVVLELTKLPKRKGIEPTTPFTGLVTVVYPKFTLAFTKAAFACAKDAIADSYVY